RPARHRAPERRRGRRKACRSVGAARCGRAGEPPGIARILPARVERAPSARRRDAPARCGALPARRGNRARPRPLLFRRSPRGIPPTMMTRRQFLLLGGALWIAACTNLIPGTGEGPQLYVLTPKTTFAPDLPKVDWQLLVDVPIAPAE